MKRTLFLLGAILFLALALFASGYDLPVAKFFYHPENRIAQAFEEGGRLILPIVAALSIHIHIAFSDSKKIRFLHIPLSALILLLIFTFSGGFDSLWQEGILTCIYLGLLLALLLIPFYAEQKQTLLLAAKSTLLATALVLLFCGAIKLLAGRMRFRDMSDLSQFVPWYVFHPFSGNTSFPSGHTANACAAFGFCYLAPLFKNRFFRILCFVLPCLLVFAMAVSRLIMGAHYVSDVLFSIGLSVFIFPIVYAHLKKSSY